MAASKPTLALTSDWINVIATTGYTDLSGDAGVLYQNRGQVPIHLFFGGVSAPSGSLDGTMLPPGGAYLDKNGSTAVWAKGPGALAIVAD